mgnify:CR=1 FL=1
MKLKIRSCLSVASSSNLQNVSQTGGNVIQRKGSFCFTFLALEKSKVKTGCERWLIRSDGNNAYVT